MEKVIRIELKEDDKSFPVRIEIYPSSVDIIVEGPDRDMANVAIELHNGNIEGYAWDEEAMDQDPIFSANLVEVEDGG